MERRNLAVRASAVLVAAVLGLLTGYFWIAEALTVSVIALFLIADTLKKAEVARPPEEAPHLVMSRIEHYARVARVKDGRKLAPTAGNPFERALLMTPSWKDLQRPELEKAVRSVPMGEAY
jgi:hypothetical protein